MTNRPRLPVMVDRPGGEVRKTVTVLFADVAGSTSLGEQLDPESLRGLMSRCFEEMRAVLERTAAPSRSTSATRSWRSSASRRP